MNTILEREFGSRLVTLQNGALGLREGLTVRTSVPKDAGSEPIVDFISSDESLDRYNEIISANGWVLDTYLKNPVFQDSHDYSTILRTIGKATVTQVRDGKLFQRIQFAVDANPLAKIAYALYKGGFLNAVSVGFVPIKWQNGDSTTAFTRKYTRQVLLETSAVAIPANPNALQLAYDSGAVEKNDLRDLLEMLRQVAGSGVRPVGPGSRRAFATECSHPQANATPNFDLAVSRMLELVEKTSPDCSGVRPSSGAATSCAEPLEKTEPAAALEPAAAGDGRTPKKLSRFIFEQRNRALAKLEEEFGFLHVRFQQGLAIEPLLDLKHETALFFGQLGNVDGSYLDANEQRVADVNEAVVKGLDADEDFAEIATRVKQVFQNAS